MCFRPDQLNTYDVLKADDVVFSVEALDAYISANTKTGDGRLRESRSHEEVSA